MVRCKIWGLSLCLILLSILVYSNTFDGEFQFDDYVSVIENPYANDISRFSGRNPIEVIWSGGRPVTTFTFALNYYFGGLDVRWYHITNFIIHIFNGILVFYLVFLTINSPRLSSHYHGRALSIAVISSAIFILHPVQTEAVSYISQRYESLASLFYLCSLIAYIKARHVSSWLIAHSNNEQRTTNNELRTLHAKRYTLYAISIISGILALGSKEIAVTIPVIIILYDFYFLEDRPPLKRIAGPGIFIILSFVIGIFILAESGKGINKAVDVGFSVREFTPWEYLMTQFRVVVTYIRLLFLPINQNLDYDFRVSRSIFELDTALSLLFLLSIITAAIMSYKRWRIGSFFILWFFIILAPTSSIFPVVDPILEHRVYLASAGIFIVVSDVLSRLILSLKEKSIYNKIAILSVVILVVMLTVVTFQRNRVWKTPLALWEDVARKSPIKARAHYNLGTCYASLGRYPEAIEEYKKSIELNRYYIEAYYNLALSLERAGLPQHAQQYYEYFYRFAPPKYDKEKKLQKLQ